MTPLAKWLKDLLSEAGGKVLRIQPFTALVLAIFCGHLPVISSAAVYESDPVASSAEVGEKTGFFIEYFTYEEYVYSLSKKTELGDNVELDMGLRYQHDENTFGRLRFKTDPVENRFDNKTSQFELLAGHKINQFNVQVDAELETNESNVNNTSGGMTFGLDLDSELTQISYDINEQFKVTFFPFNFDGEVGKEFNTWDVTRIYFVNGAPPTVDPNQALGEKLATKTIPGFELKWSSPKDLGLSFYVGGGATSYLYPRISSFDLVNSPGAPSGWQRKEDIGYKVGGTFRNDNLRIETKYVSHNQTFETGSLLKAAGSLYTIARLYPLIIELEGTYSRAGDNPYRLARNGEWFEDITPFLPVYSDTNGKRHNWIGQSDFAESLRLGYEFANSTPYITYKYQGKNFIFRERESAHRLRNFNESLSHGGLHRVGFGTFWYLGNFTVNPEFEFLEAENPVFADSSDIKRDRVYASFKKRDYLLFLTVSYNFDGSHQFKP